MNDTTESSRAVAGIAIKELNHPGHVTYSHSLTSAVTTAWGVEWNEEFIARDLMQNFFDANRNSVDAINVKGSGGNVVISAPASFNLNRLFFLGSEKGAGDVGQYGEGFKAAAVCLLRDHHITPVAISGQELVVLRVSNSSVKDTNLSPVIYDFYTLECEFPGAAVVLPACSNAMVREMKLGLSHFFYETNPLLGRHLWGGSDFSIYESKTYDGHVFYSNLKRGLIEGIPVILVINKVYQKIEQKISKDRDRNAFGEEMMDIFYKTFTSNGIKHSEQAQAIIVRTASKVWQKGHPLLRNISNLYSDYGQYNSWTPETSKNVFGEKFFARSHEDRNESHRIEIMSCESKWTADGRIPLASYFGNFGVLNAKAEIKLRMLAALAEAKKLNRRKPTPTENRCIQVLNQVFKNLAPAIVNVFEAAATNYSVIQSESVLGQLKLDRGYRSREVYFSDSLFVGDFASALAIYLHEHSHIFGYDGSRGFTDALTELIEMVVRHHDSMSEFEISWNEKRAKVIQERGSVLVSEDETEKWLNGLDEQNLRDVVSQVPKTTLKRIRATVRRTD